MQLNLEIKDRNVEFSLEDKKGEGIENLIKFVGSNSFEEIIITGETKSYSFLRQIALFVNLLIETKEIKVTLRSASFNQVEGRLFPIYEQ